MLFPITIFPCVPFASDIFLINESAKTESSCPLVVLCIPPSFGSGTACSGSRTQKGQAALFAFLGEYLTGFQQSVPALGWVCSSVHTAAAAQPLTPCWGAWACGPQMAPDVPCPSSLHNLTLERERERENENRLPL